MAAWRARRKLSRGDADGAAKEVALGALKIAVAVCCSFWMGPVAGRCVGICINTSIDYISNEG